MNLNENKNKELSKVLYILEKDDNLDYSLSTHADLNELMRLLTKMKKYMK